MTNVKWHSADEQPNEDRALYILARTIWEPDEPKWESIRSDTKAFRTFALDWAGTRMWTATQQWEEFLQGCAEHDERILGWAYEAEILTGFV